MGQFDKHELVNDLHIQKRHLPQVGCTFSLFERALLSSSFVLLALGRLMQ